MNDGLAALRAGPMHNPIPQTWTETVSYKCPECDDRGFGIIEVEETGSVWADIACGECGSEIDVWDEQ